MTKFGSAFSATDARKQAPGASHNAALRRYSNFFDLAVDGGTSETLKIADVAPGFVMDHVRIETDANLSAVNLAIGITGTLGKYSAAAAGPNATSQIRYPLLSLKLNATTGREELMLSTSGNLPSSGSLRVTVYGSHI